MPQLEILREKLDTLAAADPDLKLFGAEAHKYTLGPMLSEEEISRIEQEYKIKLPEGYRQFLLEMGDGGAGPYLGIQPLASAINGTQRDHDILSRPFPLDKPLDVFEECVEDGTLDDYYERIQDDEDYYDETLECVAKFSGPYYTQGSIYLCDFGDAIVFHLPVTGPESGNIWVEDLQGDFGGIFPVSNEGKGATRTNFLKWYENWLDKNLRSANGEETDDEGGYFTYA
jgi:hypothetical protein